MPIYPSLLYLTRVASEGVRIELANKLVCLIREIFALIEEPGLIGAKQPQRSHPVRKEQIKET